uniref:Uncharacterized protein n=1 Tax=Favella ehrenbergii TaxID=182087 RepID=A0A7S3I882_9SPIT|mmetsp:Transcript_7784/g.9386  ORF Transcript_7784/g.9386 Transcript_7784/m.9386 type:complete len:108 (+) Transcript_7784:117-440(+)
MIAPQLLKLAFDFLHLEDVTTYLFVFSHQLLPQMHILLVGTSRRLVGKATLVLAVCPLSSRTYTEQSFHELLRSVCLGTLCGTTAFLIVAQSVVRAAFAILRSAFSS